MIMSMTGFGRATAQSGQMKFTAELKSLNSKQLDLLMRVAPPVRELEPEFRNMVAAGLERGKVELTLSLEQGEGGADASFNTAAIARYASEMRRASEETGVPLPADMWNTILRLPDTVETRGVEPGEEDLRCARQALEGAMEALREFRAREGEKLYGFFVGKIAEISALLDEVEPMEAERVPRIRQRLEEQLARLDSVEYDRGRLEQELIFYIEKLDVTEEKTRLRSHLSYFLETMGSAEDPAPRQGQGKKLGFIAQEMGREINTLGSKANHAGIQQTVVRMKDALEQIKEQVLNVL